MRVALTLSYNGVNFLGSQVQTESKNTIFGQFEAVLLQLGIEYRVVASGRTDRGVHATGQVCHFDLPPFWSDLTKLRLTLNQMLPTSLHVRKIIQVSDDFHARYSAKKRSYRYLLKTCEPNPFESDFITFVKNLDFEQVSKNIKLFEGEHDFKNFKKTGSETKSTTRFIFKAYAYKHKNAIVLIFEANGFLRSQIRLMVGALLSLNAQQIKDKLNNSYNHKVKPAPSNGLYLSKILY